MADMRARLPLHSMTSRAKSAAADLGPIHPQLRSPELPADSTVLRSRDHAARPASAHVDMYVQLAVCISNLACERTAMSDRFRYEPKTTLQKMAMRLKHPRQWRAKITPCVFDTDSVSAFNWPAMRKK